MQTITDAVAKCCTWCFTRTNAQVQPAPLNQPAQSNTRLDQIIRANAADEAKWTNNGNNSWTYNGDTGMLMVPNHIQSTATKISAPNATSVNIDNCPLIKEASSPNANVFHLKNCPLLEKASSANARILNIINCKNTKEISTPNVYAVHLNDVPQGAVKSCINSIQNAQELKFSITQPGTNKRDITEGVKKCILKERYSKQAKFKVALKFTDNTMLNSDVKFTILQYLPTDDIAKCSQLTKAESSIECNAAIQTLRKHDEAFNHIFSIR